MVIVEGVCFGDRVSLKGDGTRRVDKVRVYFSEWCGCCGRDLGETGRKLQACIECVHKRVIVVGIG